MELATLEVAVRRKSEEIRPLSVELEEKVSVTAGLAASFSDLSQRLEALEAEVRSLRATTGRTKPRAEPAVEATSTSIRWLGGAFRQVGQLVGRRLLATAAATAAVPVAVTVGASAALAERASRLLPQLAPRRTLISRIEPLATLVILNYQGRDLLEKNLPHCVAAIEFTGKPHRILVIDNGSTDGSIEFLASRFPGVDTVSLPRNLFFSRGNNAGLHAAEHDIIVLLNNDMRVERDFLQPLLEPFQLDDEVFAVSSQILMDADKRREETGLTRGRLNHGILQLRHDPIPPDVGSEPFPILWAGGGAAAFDRRKFLALGGLDVLYDPFYCEDADLSLRAWKRGWKVLFAPRSRVWHDHRTTSRRVFGEEFVNEIFRRNQLLLQWVNLDAKVLVQRHLPALPDRVYEDTLRHGWSGVRSLARATARIPRAMVRRLREGARGHPVEQILPYTEAQADPIAASRPRSRVDEKLRIVMLSPYDVYPVRHGGAARMYHVLRELARRGHDVSLVGLVDHPADLEAAEPLREFLADLKLVVRSHRRATTLNALPREVLEFEIPELRHELVKMVARHDASVLQIEYTHMARYLMPSPRLINCLTEHDVAFVSLYRRMKAQPPGPARREIAQAYLKMFRFELEVLPRFDRVFTVSSRDARVLDAYLGERAAVSDRAPIGADLETMERICWVPAEPRVVFLGNFAHTPNVDAALHLLRDIMPRVWAAMPEAQVSIVGRGATPEMLAAGRDPRVGFKGFVADLTETYSTAGVVVVPVRMGSGVRVKLLEAMAAGVPVVSTSAGAEGVDVAHGEHLLIADGAEPFAAQVLRLLRDAHEARRLAMAGRAFVSSRYAWPRIVAQLEDEYRQALQQKMGASR